MPMRMAAWAAATVPTVKVASRVSFSEATRAVMIFCVLAGGRASCSLKASSTLPVSASTRIQALAGYGCPGGGAACAPAGAGRAVAERIAVTRNSSAHTGASEERRCMGTKPTRPSRSVSGPAVGSEAGATARLALPLMASRVLVTEPLAQVGLDTLSAAGFEVDVAVGLTPEDLLGAVGGASALVIRSATQVTADVLEAGTELVVVGRAGIGLDNVDVATATRKGVMVVNAPQSNILSAAEHAVALLISQARNVPQADADLKAGNWRRSKWEGVELHGKTLGIVGLGRIGGLVAQRALAFGMHLIAYDPYVSAERARQMGVDLLPTVEEVAAQSDFLSIHLPRTPETKGLIGRDLFERAKPGIRIVNAARGGIVDEEALYRSEERRV